MKKILKTCSRGHTFYKSSDCPTCPKCWPGFYKKLISDFPVSLSAPALRALHHAKITKLARLAKYTEAEILGFHGMGPKAIKELKSALRKKDFSFKKKKTFS